MEKIAQFLLAFFYGLFERIERRKAEKDHAAAVRDDPGTAWLRRFGGHDSRKDGASTCNTRRDSD